MLCDTKILNITGCIICGNSLIINAFRVMYSSGKDVLLIVSSKLQIFCIGCVLEKHNVINGKIGYLSVVRDGSFVGEDISFFNMIILVLNKGVQCTVNGVILA